MSTYEFMQSLKKNKYIDNLTRQLMFPYFFLKYRQFDKEALERHKGKIDKRYLWIKDLKNKHIRERCFIVATGPSLTIEDLELIKDEFSFSMNSAVLAFEKTNWRPDYFLCQDEYVYLKIKKDIEKSASNDLKNVWVSEIIRKKFDIPENIKVFPLHYLDHKMYHRQGYGEFKFSKDCYECIYDAYTVTFSAMQLAYYMGFSEIYLLGCDCNYNQEKSHFIEHGHKDPKSSVMGDKMIYAHGEFKKFAESVGLKVINCTRGGMLEIYPRKNLEDVLN